MNPRRKSETVYQKVIRYFRYPRFAIYAFIILWVIVIWVNIPFPILNPSNAPKPYNWTFTYPSSPPNTLYFDDPSETIYFQMTVSANQPFVDGADIQTDVIGSMGKALTDNIDHVRIGFQGAYPYGLDQGTYMSGSPFAGVDLNPSQTKPDNAPVFIGLGGLYLVGNKSDIEFRNYGDFSPTIQITFTNHSSPVTYTYQDFILPIQSSASLRQDRMNYAIGVTTLGGFFFVVLDLIPRLRKDSR